jgi:acyl-CoA synthetase (AMP-forming)/AMP-acid ligase II
VVDVTSAHESGPARRGQRAHNAGILAAGAVVVPVVFLLSPEEVRYILADADARARVVVTASQFLDKLQGWLTAT